MYVQWTDRSTSAAATLELSDVTGEKIMLATLHPGIQQINIANLASGMYLSTITLADGRVIVRSKMVKE